MGRMGSTAWKILGMIAALALGVAEGQAQQRSGRMPDRNGAGLAITPLDRLLDARADLGLSEKQVTAIKAIRDTLLTDTEPLRSRLAAMRQEGSGPGEDGRALMQQLRDRNSGALEATFELLDDQQRRSAMLLLQRRRPRGTSGSPGRDASLPRVQGQLVANVTHAMWSGAV